MDRRRERHRERQRQLKRRLFVLGNPLDVEPRIPGKSASLEEALFEAARVVSDEVSARVAQRARLQGESISCREGCAACCQQLVPVSPIEAARVAKRASAKTRKRFAEAVRRLERAGLVDPGAPRGRSAMTVLPENGESLWDTLSRRYRELAIDCPFLEERRCSIYEDRPLVCREYAVTSPAENCAGLEGVDALPRPIRMSEALADVSGAPSIPLVLALEWAAHHAPKLPEDPAQALVDAIVVED